MLHRIASLDDPRVAEYRNIADHAALTRSDLFVAEGRLVVQRLLASPRFATESVLVTDTALEALQDTLEKATVNVFVVDQRTMNAIAGFNIHRGCLALGKRPPTGTLDELSTGAARRLIVLEGVNNPDNVGGIFRSAAAFGVDAVVLGPACSDPLYRKSVRTSMAATLVVPFVDAGEWPAALAALQARGWIVVALTPDADAGPLGELRRDLERVALLVGAEGEGLSAAAMAAADRRVRIPMSAAIDSLNVTVAASIALYHLRT